MPTLPARTLLLLIPVLALPSSAGAGDLAAVLQPLVDDHDGDVAVCVRHLETGESYAHRADEVQPTASLIKLAVMVAAYRRADTGELDLDQRIELRDEDKVPGSGILTEHFSAGIQLSLRDAIRLMIVWSDNTATNLVVDRIGLPTTASTMQQLGFEQTRLHALVYRRDTSLFPERSERWGLGSTTANETVDLLARLHSRDIATPESCEAMLEHLERCDDRSRLARDLPAGVRLAHKSGAVSRVRCDAGILWTSTGPVALCVLTENNADAGWSPDNAADTLCARIGRRVYDHFQPVATPAAEPAGGPLQSGASGRLVEMLQRTLNARLKPSPELSVDGEFGPVTESAVRDFQRSVALPVTGTADSATLDTLGPLLEEQPVPDPATVNSEDLPLRPADPLQGVPFVTCKAWLIVDGASGESIGGHDADRPLDIASTTKVMTAWLVLKHAEQHPDCLDEVLTMSRRADETRGSTSGLRAGEQLTVNDALYGLLLPSGNDMSVALAEHFGQRLVAESEASADPLELFVQAMNAEAAALDLQHTTFRNPHGLTADRHVSTCRDLITLARTAFNNERFRSVVRTRQFGTTVTGAEGYRRNVVWTNTNRLLRIAGYHGLKTGTTSAAGACLLSTATRGDRRLFAVVLGSAASASRYTDTRNLYRWAWNELPSSD